MKNLNLLSEHFAVAFLSLGSLTIVLFAIGVGEVLDLQACKLCIYARWPHFLAFAVLPFYYIYAFRLFKIILVSFGALTMLASFLISGYHSGVEAKIWKGPDTCSKTLIDTEISTDELLDKILSTPITRCDEVTWNFIYLSMANWNSIISLIFFIIWLRHLNNLLFNKTI